MQGAAGVRHQGRHAEFGEHLRGGIHLGGTAHGVPARPVSDPVQDGGIGRGKFGGDVLAQPVLVTRGPGGVQGLDDRGCHPLVEHAAQQLPGGGEPGRPVENLDLGTERAEQGGIAGGACSAGQHRDAQAATGDGGHDRDVGEREAGSFRDVRQLPFGARRCRVQIGPQGVPALAGALVRAQPGQAGRESADRGLGAVDAQHQVRSARGVGFAAGVEDGTGRGDSRIVAADAHPGGHQVTRDDGPGLA